MWPLTLLEIAVGAVLAVAWSAFVLIGLAGSVLQLAVQLPVGDPAAAQRRQKTWETARGIVCAASGRHAMEIPSRARVLSGVLMLFLMAGALPAFAQDAGRFELGGYFSTLNLNEFDITDPGVGVQAAWRLTPTLAVDGALGWFPEGDTISSSSFQNQQRVLGAAGLRAGLRRGRIELFGKARPGFLRFNRQDSAGVCILIFPTPLDCQLATGYTAFAFDLGGGTNINLDRLGRTFLRVDAGDLMVRYALESYRPNGEITDGFIGHNFMVNIGGGWRF